MQGVEKQVRQVLGNPGSTSFEDVAFFPQTGAGCGVVKARYKAGGSAWFISFVALADGAVHFGPSEDLSPEEMSTLANAQAMETLVARTRQSCPSY